MNNDFRHRHFAYHLSVYISIEVVITHILDANGNTSLFGYCAARSFAAGYFNVVGIFNNAHSVFVDSCESYVGLAGSVKSYG